MELVDRYLQAVKFGLPKKHKQDIIAELSEDLHAQIEEQETTVGRPLNQDEIAAILKKYGPPMQVALRYQPQRSLIGPQLFPIYLFVLKLVWMCFFGPWLVIGIALDLFVAVNRTGLYDGLTAVLNHFWLAAITNFLVVTLIFASIERYHPGVIENSWDPLKLPKVRDANRIPRSSSISELAWYGMISLWWIGVFHLPSMCGLSIGAAPFIARFLFYPILVLLLGHAIVAGINLLRPMWTRRRASFRAALDALGIVVLGVLLMICFTGGTFVTVTSTHLPTSDILAAEKWFTWGWVVLLLIWCEIGYVIGFVQDARRVTRWSRSHPVSA